MTSRPVAIVTGAGRGIGRGIAISLAELEYFVVINYTKNHDAAQECLELVRNAGGDGIVVRADISLAQDRKELVQESLAVANRVDLLVNNAGVAPDVRSDVLEADEASFTRLIDINLKGPYFLTQLVARQMIQQVEQGIHTAEELPKIITITSISAYTASVTRGDYCISKAGLSMLTALYAARLAEYGINVYEIRPGVIETDMTEAVRDKYDAMIDDGVWPIRRWGRPSDVGSAVASIARGGFPFSTGEVFNVDGGFQLRTL